MNRLRVVRTTSGKSIGVEVNMGEVNPCWLPLPFDPGTKTFTPTTEREHQLMIYAEIQHEWSELDLTDHEPEQETVKVDFRLLMLNDPAFRRACNLLSPLDVSALSVIINNNPLNVDVLMTTWNQHMIAIKLLLNLQAVEVNRWNGYATQAQMNFSFKNDGTIIKHAS